MAKPDVVQFTEVGVTVTVPAQRVTVKVVKLPIGTLADRPGVPGGFQPGRQVINFELVDEKAPDTFLTEFDPPFQLRVQYTKPDLDRAADTGRPLALAFWDGSQWVVFTREKHQFELHPNTVPETGGYATVEISKWGDPPVAWGS